MPSLAVGHCGKYSFPKRPISLGRIRKSTLTPKLNFNFNNVSVVRSVWDCVSAAEVEGRHQDQHPMPRKLPYNMLLGMYGDAWVELYNLSLPVRHCHEKGHECCSTASLFCPTRLLHTNFAVGSIPTPDSIREPSLSATANAVPRRPIWTHIPSPTQQSAHYSRNEASHQRMEYVTESSEAIQTLTYSLHCDFSTVQ